MKFEDATQFVEEYVDKTKFRPLFGTIMSHIDCLMNDKPLPEFNSEDIKSDVRELYANLFDHQTEFEYIRFLEAFSELIFNWNENTINDPDISIYANSMKKIIPVMMNTKNSVLVMKEAIEKFRRYRGWAPPIGDITLAYLDVLLKENK